MSFKWGDPKYSQPSPEETELGGYYLAYSELESWLRQLVVRAIASTHGHSGDRYWRTRLMVEALTGSMNFHQIEEVVEAIIEIRAQGLNDESRDALRSEWTSLKGSCANERGFRNRLAHRSVTTPEELGGALHIAGKNPETYSAAELREKAEAVYRLTDRVQELAVRLSYEVPLD